jgi:hypothetical protein
MAASPSAPPAKRRAMRGGILDLYSGRAVAFFKRPGNWIGGWIKPPIIAKKAKALE